MVNKAAVILLGGIVLVAVVVVGGVAALVLGGGGDAGGGGTPTAVEPTPLPESQTATAANGPATRTTESAPTPTATETTAGTATATAVPRTTILPRRFDERRVEVLVGRYVNEYREAAGLDPLRQNGTTAERVTVMARDHSVEMANAGTVTHDIGGNESAQRYEDHDLYRTCQWQSGLRDSVVRPDNNGPQSTDNALETVGRTFAGREYGDGAFNGDEEAVARAIVDAWWSDNTFNTRLSLPNAGSIGVGVEITQSGEVYATANLCS